MVVFGKRVFKATKKVLNLHKARGLYKKRRVYEKQKSKCFFKGI